MSIHTYTDYINFLNNHGTRLRGISDCAWVAERDIPAFKAVWTYMAGKGNPRLVYCPDDRLQSLKETFLGHHGLVNREVPAIVNLIIPKGAQIYFNPYEALHGFDFGKMRTDRAFIHSIVRKYDKKQVAYGISSHRSSFVYVNPMMTGRKTVEVVPDDFSFHRGTCAPGIHFYLDDQKALNYLI